jgi:hypothetical protein
MEKIVKELEKNIGFRIVSIILTFTAILDLMSSDEKVSVGNIFLAGILAIVFVSIFIGLISFFSVRSVRKLVENQIDVLQKQSKTIIESVGDEKDEQVEKSKTSVSKIGFNAGWKSGLVVGILVMLFLGADSLLGALFFAAIISFCSGVVGIVSAHIGWNTFDEENVNERGAITGYAVGCLVIAVLSGNFGTGLFLGIPFAFPGWWSAKQAYRIRKR